MRVFSTFSGISAASQAWKKELNFEFVAYCDPNPYACHVLNQRQNATKPIYLPEGKEFNPRNYRHIEGGHIPNYGDISQIKDYDLKTLGKIDILEGGSPCQSFSMAGLRQGLQDERGNLALEFARLVNRMREINNLEYVIYENVPGILSHRDNPFGCLLAALAGEQEHPLVAPGGKWPVAGHVTGPDCKIAWRCLDAQFFGVAQRRKRLFLVASFGVGCIDPGSILIEQASGARGFEQKQASRQEVTGSAGRGTGIDPVTCMAFLAGAGAKAHGLGVSDKVSPTLKAASSGTNQVPTVIHPPIVGTLCASGAGTERTGLQKNATDFVVVTPSPTPNSKWVVRRLTPKECERLQGFEDGYTAISYRGKPVSDGLRYRGLGNSMAVPVMRWIGRRLLSTIQQHQIKEMKDAA